MADLLPEDTPSLAQVIMQAVQNALVDLHVSLPGRILEYDSGTNKAKVQLEIKRSLVTGETIEIPPISDVIVAWPRAGKAFIHLPLKAGHKVQVMFTERSTDEWRQDGQTVAPTSKRRFNFSDAWCIPGGYPFSDPVAGSSTDVLIVNDKTEFRQTPAGKMAFKGQGGEEFVTIVVELLTILKAATTNTIFGPMKLNEFAQIEMLETRLKKLKV